MYTILIRDIARIHFHNYYEIPLILSFLSNNLSNFFGIYNVFCFDLQFDLQFDYNLIYNVVLVRSSFMSNKSIKANSIMKYLTNIFFNRVGLLTMFLNLKNDRNS